MKPASTALQDLLATRNFHFCGLYAFTLIDGTALYYASGDVDIKVGSQVYSCGGTSGPYLDRTGNRAKVSWKLGLEVDTLSFDVMPGSSTVEGIPFLSAVRQGVFDGAELTYSRAYWPKQDYQTPVVPTDTLVLFVGRVAEIDFGRSAASFQINSHLELLNQPMPRNLYQGGCVNTLYDASCGLAKASFGIDGTAGAGSTASLISMSFGQATGYFDLGSIQFTSGANAGIARGVKSYTHGSPGSASLTMPFPAAPATGDAFTIYPGCDKTLVSCASKFNNLANNRSFPFVPTNETAV